MNKLLIFAIILISIFLVFQKQYILGLLGILGGTYLTTQISTKNNTEMFSSGLNKFEMKKNGKVHEGKLSDIKKKGLSKLKNITKDKLSDVKEKIDNYKNMDFIKLIEDGNYDKLKIIFGSFDKNMKGKIIEKIISHNPDSFVKLTKNIENLPEFLESFDLTNLMTENLIEKITNSIDDDNMKLEVMKILGKYKFRSEKF